mmetsp:Transcript_46117/g.68702  ORF Transcript_46117/g.68702 Transcript_46117/m.68702 type:complete len:253 (+) Transcript_46117:3181-3939(+)
MPDHQRRTYRSRAIISSHLGRWIFSATVSPLDSSLALYTCPIEAAATGSSCTSSNTSPNLIPSSSSTVASASSFENLGTSSCSFCNSSKYSEGNKSGREANACPPLIMAGPSPEMAWRSCFARTLRFDCELPAAKSAITHAAHQPTGKAICIFRMIHFLGCRNNSFSAAIGSYRTSGSATLTPRAQRVTTSLPSCRCPLYQKFSGTTGLTSTAAASSGRTTDTLFMDVEPFLSFTGGVAADVEARSLLDAST